MSRTSWASRVEHRVGRLGFGAAASLIALAALATLADAARTHKPPLHGQKWMAVTGKPLAAVAGARSFLAGGNAVDAACAMLAASCTLWDTLGWGGETQALVWDPHAAKVIGVNALGTAPAAATPELYRAQGLRYPPEYGPLAAVLPGTPGGLFAMLAEWGRLPLAKVLEPAIELADGFPIEAQLAGTIRRQRERLAGWPFSRALFLPRAGEAPEPGEIFRQPDLARTLRRLVEAERAALAAGADRRAAIRAADELFYRGALARELAEAVRAAGGLITAADLAAWHPRFEPSVSTTYRGVEVHKLTVWTQGPALLQALNLLEQEDLAALGYKSARYLHAVAQAMHLAFADRDFYYGDPDFPPAEPVAGLLAKEYARERWQAFDPARNRLDLGPGDPYPYQGGSNPFAALLREWRAPAAGETRPGFQVSALSFDESFRAGTTSVVAADAEGWVVSMTPSGAWVPAVVAGTTGIGLSQRMQSFVLDERDGPYNVLAPGKRPRVTLTPTLALKEGRPWLAFAVQGGDTQDQNLLQFFLDVVEFGMTPQEAVEAANLNSYQMRSSFGAHASEPGRLTLRADLPEWVRDELRRKGYRLDFEERTSGPVTAIEIDRAHGTLWGAASDYGEDTGIGW